MLWYCYFPSVVMTATGSTLRDIVLSTKSPNKSATSTNKTPYKTTSSDSDSQLLIVPYFLSQLSLSHVFHFYPKTPVKHHIRKHYIWSLIQSLLSLCTPSNSSVVAEVCFDTQWCAVLFEAFVRYSTWIILTSLTPLL